MDTQISSARARRSPLVGRDRELAEIARYLEDARAGHGALVLLAGEAGIGKTRLAQETQRLAGERGFLTLLGHEYEGEGTLPYISFVEALEGAARSLGPEALRDALAGDAPNVARIVPQLKDAIADIASPAQTPPEHERYHLFNAVRDVLLRVSAQRPVLLVLEDLHWVDVPSALLLRHLAQFLDSARLLILGTYRDDEIEGADGVRQAPLLQFVEDVHRLRLGSIMRLEPLSQEHVASMVQALAGEGLPAAVSGAVYQKTEGNPFFVEEVMRHLEEEGRLHDASALARDGGVPEGVRIVTARRLTRVSERCRRTLAAAAVIGRTFDYDLLAAVVDVPPDDLLDTIEEGERARLVVSQRDEYRARLSFTHELVRQTLLQATSAPRRQHLHLRIAETVERLYGASDPQRAADLAYHYQRAGSTVDREQTLGHVLRAAQGAMTATAYEEAVPLFEAALGLLDRDDRERRCDLLLRLGDAEKRISDSDEARARYAEAADLARATGRDAQLCHAALGFARSWPSIGVVDEPAVRLLREAVGVCPDTTSATRAVLLARLALQLYYSGAFDEVEALSAEAVDTARRSGDLTALARTLQTRHVILWEPSHLQERLAVATEIIDIAARVGDEEIALWGHRPRIADYAEQGDIAAMEAEIARYRHIADGTRRPLYLWQAAVRQAMLAIYRGRAAEGERLAQEALELGQRAGGQNLMAAFGGQLLAARWQQGRLGELEPLIKASLERQPREPTWLAVLAFIYSESDRPAEARAAYEALFAPDAPALPTDNTRLIVASVLAIVCAALGDASRAARLYDLLRPYEGLNVVIAEGVVCIGAADEYLGLLAATARRWDDAQRHFERALAMNERGGGLAWLAHTQLDYARMLLARRERGDRRRAVELLDTALQHARQLGMGALVARIERLRRSHKQLLPAGPEGLTPREVEVLVLLARGHSNREISEELSLSPRTTARHITNVYAKIGARNRAGATAYALRNGLVSD